MMKDHTSFSEGAFLLLEGPKALGFLDKNSEPEGI